MYKKCTTKLEILSYIMRSFTTNMIGGIYSNTQSLHTAKSNGNLNSGNLLTDLRPSMAGKLQDSFVSKERPIYTQFQLNLVSNLNSLKASQVLKVNKGDSSSGIL